MIINTISFTINNSRKIIIIVIIKIIILIIFKIILSFYIHHQYHPSSYFHQNRSYFHHQNYHPICFHHQNPAHLHHQNHHPSYSHHHSIITIIQTSCPKSSLLFPSYRRLLRPSFCAKPTLTVNERTSQSGKRRK